jgi:hypothetical protein
VALRYTCVPKCGAFPIINNYLRVNICEYNYLVRACSIQLLQGKFDYKYIAILTVWLAQVLKELGFEIGAVPVCVDNQGAIFITSNKVIERQSKHIDICYHYMQELIFDKQVELFYLEGVSNPADTLTKSLGQINFVKCQNQLGLTIQ